MSLNDTLATVLSQIKNSITVGKLTVVTKFSSKLIKQVLEIMHEEGYIGDVQETIDSKGDFLTIQLIGKLNSCGVIKPRFAINLAGF